MVFFMAGMIFCFSFTIWLCHNKWLIFDEK